LEFPPWDLLSWKNRFDHPGKLFRTLYCAEQRRTALREVLADFRPNAKARAEFKDLFGSDLPAPQVTSAWRQTRMLAQGTLKVLRGDLVKIDDPLLRQRFAQLHAGLLDRHGMDHLDIAQIRGKDRPVTQEVTRFVAAQGAAGVVYGSNLDDQPCAALFEGRSCLVAVDSAKPEPLIPSHPDLAAVCDEFGLALKG
jgi:RES domain